MNILTYNIIRKMIENPLSVRYERNVIGNSGVLYIKNESVLSISYMRNVGVYMNFKYQLNDKDIRKILSVVEHCEAMQIRNL